MGGQRLLAALEKPAEGKFPWPRSLQKARAISNEQLMMLLSGIDCWNILPVLKYESIG